jgi:hypothetical protein
MEADQERDLPTASWGQVDSTNLNPVQPGIIPQRDIAAEMQEWAPTFQALGWDVAEAMRVHADQFSAVLCKPMRTFEDVYAHLTTTPAQQPVPQDDVSDHISAEEPGKRRRSAITDEQRHRVEFARANWKQAIEARKQALRQWDEYVRALHEEFVRVRDALK